MRAIHYVTLLLFSLILSHQSFASKTTEVTNLTESFYRSIEALDFTKALETLNNHGDQIDVNLVRGADDDTVFSLLIKKARDVKDDGDQYKAWKNIFSRLLLKKPDLKKRHRHGETTFLLASKYLPDSDLLNLLKSGLEYSLKDINTDKRNAAIFMAMNSSKESLEYLLSQNLAEDFFLQQDSRGMNALFYLLSENNSDETVKELISRYPKSIQMRSILNQNLLPHTPLQLAARLGKTDIVKMILSQEGVDIDYRGAKGNGKTALMFASEFGDTEMVSSLINKGASKIITDDKGNTAAHLAVLSGRSDNAILLIDEQNLNMLNGEKNSLLHISLATTQEAVTNYLFENGYPELTKVNSRAQHPFLLALMHQNTKSIDYFLNKGFDLDQIIDIKATPAIFYLLRNFSPETIRKFTQDYSFSNMNSFGVDENGETVEHFLAKKGMSDELFSFLLKNPRRINSRDNDGNTIAFKALKGGHLELAKKLVSFESFNPSLTNKKENTFLIDAIEYGDLEFVKLLLDKHGKELIKNNKGIPALNKAIEVGNDEIINILLALPYIDVHKMDKSTGSNSVKVAVKNHNYRVLDYLLNSNDPVDPYESDFSNISAFALAVQSNDTFAMEKIYQAFPRKEQLNEALFTAIASYQFQFQTLDKLLMLGADLNAISTRGDSTGYSLIGYALKLEQNDIAQYLITSGLVDLNYFNPYQKTALMLAVEKGNVEIVESLLEERSVNINLGHQNRKKEYLKNPLLIALSLFNPNDDAEIAQSISSLLINHPDIDLEVTTPAGNTPLLLALENVYDELAIEMINNGADFNKENYRGESAIKLVLRYGALDILKEMVKKGASFNSPKIKIAVLGEVGSDPDALMELVKMGANIDDIKKYLSQRNVSFDLAELFKKMEDFLVQCKNEHEQNNGAGFQRFLASEIYIMQIGPRACIDYEFWKEIEENTPHKVKKEPEVQGGGTNESPSSTNQ